MSRVEPLELVVTALHAGKCKPHRSDTGYTAHCPAHDDRNPSLSVNTGDDGRVLLKCHAGCTLEAILQALNLDPGDLFARSNLECPKPPVTVETIKYVEVVPKDAPLPPENHPKLRQPTMKWVYRASNGWPAFLVLRFDDDRGKTIRPLTLWRKNGGLTWKWKAPPAPRPLFALPALASRAGDSVLIVEGEKAAEAAQTLFPDLVVTTSSGGSAAAGKTDWTPLRERAVTIWPDNDEAGLSYATKVASLAREAGASSISIVRVPEDWSPGWDLADQLPFGIDRDDLATMIRSAEPFVPENKVVDEIQISSQWDYLPEPLQRELPDPAPYPVEALGDILGPACSILHRIIQAPTAACAHSLLSATALLTQALADIEVDGRISPLSLYLLTVLESGGRKSTVDSAALGQIFEAEHTNEDKYRSAWSKYQIELETWENEKKSILKTRAKKTQSEIKEGVNDLGPKPPRPMNPMMVTEEPTYEGLVKLFEDRPFLGLFSDEGGRFLGGHAMNSDNRLKTMAGLSNIWDGRRITRTRVGDGSKALFGRRLSLHLMIQPEVSEKLLGDHIAQGQGILARFLIVAPTSPLGNQRYVESNPKDTKELQRYEKAIRSLLLRELPLRDRCVLEPPTISLEPPAKRRWMAFHDAVQSEIAEGGRLHSVRAFAAKAAEHALRLAGVLHVLEMPTPGAITKNAIDRAIELVQFYLTEALRLWGITNANPDLIVAERLLRWMQRQESELIPQTLIYQNGPTAVRTKEQAEKYLKILENHDWVRSTTAAGKRRQKVWMVCR